MIEKKHTKDILANELRKAGLLDMSIRAAQGYYHDYLSPLAMPCQQLAADLAAVGTPEADDLRCRHLNGEFDANLEESEAWARSPDGQAASKELTPAMREVLGMPEPESQPAKVKRVDANNLSEAEAIRRFGKKMSDFMKAVAKARKKYGIEAYALWMYHDGAMRVCSTGVDGTGRELAKGIATMMAEQNEALMENVARKMDGKLDQ